MELKRWQIYFQCHDDLGDDNDNDDGAMAVTNAHQHVTHWPISSCDKGSKGAVRPIDRPWKRGWESRLKSFKAIHNFAHLLVAAAFCLSYFLGIYVFLIIDSLSLHDF